jgi:hypothetical protein
MQWQKNYTVHNTHPVVSHVGKSAKFHGQNHHVRTLVLLLYAIIFLKRIIFQKTFIVPASTLTTLTDTLRVTPAKTLRADCHTGSILLGTG